MKPMFSNQVTWNNLQNAWIIISEPGTRWKNNSITLEMYPWKWNEQ